MLPLLTRSLGGRAEGTEHREQIQKRPFPSGRVPVRPAVVVAGRKFGSRSAYAAGKTNKKKTSGKSAPVRAHDKDPCARARERA